MKPEMRWTVAAGLSAGLGASLLLGGCSSKPFDASEGAPQTPQVIDHSDPSLVSLPHAERYSTVPAGSYEAHATMNVTGSVNPDISREVPVISLASGRVVDIRTQLDANVRKGQLLLRVQSPDVTNAFDAYLKAVNDEQLARKADARARDLYQHGAIPQSQVEQADDSEKDAQADLMAAGQQLRTLGIDKNHPSSIVNVYAPISGVVVAQNVTNAAAAGVTYAGSSSAFTIADLSKVWVICDVYENQIAQLHLGQEATIHLDAYPGMALQGRVSDIGPILDPTIRTAKVRIEVPNSGNVMRLGMFVTATLASRQTHTFSTVPASAVLHLHDRDWVFTRAGNDQFRRVEVQLGDTLPDGGQQVLSGVQPGEPVVANVLGLETALEAQ